MYWPGTLETLEGKKKKVSTFTWPALAHQQHLNLQHRLLCLSHTLPQLQQCNSKLAAKAGLHEHTTRGKKLGKKDSNKALLARGWAKDKWFVMHHPQRYCCLPASDCLPVRSMGNLQKDPCQHPCNLLSPRVHRWPKPQGCTENRFLNVRG